MFVYGMHPTGLCGIFGAAAAASVAIGARPRRLRMRPGHRRYAGRGSDRMARGRIVDQAPACRPLGAWWRAGGSFGKRGLYRPCNDLRGRRRLVSRLRAYGTDGSNVHDAGFGKDWRALGTAIKPYPCCRFEHGALDLARRPPVAASGRTILHTVGVRIYRTNVLSYHKEPKNAVDAQFNVPYAVAVAFVKKAVRLGDFTEEGIKVIQPCSLSPSVSMSRRMKQFSGQVPAGVLRRVKITLRDGTVRTLLSECPSGDPEAKRYRSNPALLGVRGSPEDCFVACRMWLRRTSPSSGGMRHRACTIPDTDRTVTHPGRASRTPGAHMQISSRTWRGEYEESRLVPRHAVHAGR